MPRGKVQEPAFLFRLPRLTFRFHALLCRSSFSDLLIAFFSAACRATPDFALVSCVLVDSICNLFFRYESDKLVKLHIDSLHKAYISKARMGKVGTKSVKQPDLSKVNFATEEIAESWKQYYEDALESKQRRKRSLSMLYLIWQTIHKHTKWKKKKNEIDRRTGIGWRQLNRTFTKHSLSMALSLLLEEGLIERIEDMTYKGRGRKPTRYFALRRPFVTYPGYYIGEIPIFGTLSTRHGKWARDIVIKDPNSKGSYLWNKVAKRRVTQSIRRLSREKEWIDRRCADDEPFAAAVRLAEGKRKTAFIETKLEK